jgi:hypothetical protein
MSDSFTTTERWRLFYALSPLVFVVAIWIMGQHYFLRCLDPERTDQPGEHLQWPVQVVDGLFLAQFIWSLIAVLLTRGRIWRIAVLLLALAFLMLGFFVHLDANMRMRDIWL